MISYFDNLALHLELHIKWLNNAFGLTDKTISENGVILPACYRGNKEYTILTPDDLTLSNFSYFSLPEDIEITPDYVTGKALLNVWVNTEDVNLADFDRETVLRTLVSALRRAGSVAMPVKLKVKNEEEILEKVVTAPYYAVEIEFTFKYYFPC